MISLVIQFPLNSISSHTARVSMCPVVIVAWKISLAFLMTDFLILEFEYQSMSFIFFLLISKKLKCHKIIFFFNPQKVDDHQNFPTIWCSRINNKWLENTLVITSKCHWYAQYLRQTLYCHVEVGNSKMNKVLILTIYLRRKMCLHSSRWKKLMNEIKEWGRRYDINKWKN